jgi:primosomal protein N'
VIARVYPFLKLPRRFSFFDYAIPEGMSVAPGDLVRITFRGRFAVGLVKGLTNTSEAKKLSSVESIAVKSWCTGGDIERFETVSDSLAQGVPSLLYLFGSPFNDRTQITFAPAASSLKSVSKKDVEEATRLLAQIDESHGEYATLFGDKEMGAMLAHLLRKKTKGQLLILLARERDAELLLKTMPLGDKAVMLHGKTPEKERARIMDGWRRGEVMTLVTTKLGSLLPAKELETILVLDAGLDDHLNLRRNPRFDAREAVKLLAKQHSAKLIFIDNFPRLEECLDGFGDAKPLPEAEPLLISLRDRTEYTKDPLITETLIEEIKRALQSQKKVLLFLNRKGVAKRLQCSACGHLPLCGNCGNSPTVRLDDLICDRCGTEMWIPELCPHCGKPKIGLKGVGGTKIEDILRAQFPDAVIGRIEKGSPKNDTANILIATEYFFSSVLPLFAEKSFGLIADLAADVGLHGSDFRAGENTLRKVQRFLYFGKRQGAKVIIQTWLPDTVRPMLNLEKWITDELALRKKYRLPPYATRVVLPEATYSDLPETYQPYFTQRKEELEARVDLPYTPPSFTDLSDAIKLVYDGPYVKHGSPPQSE